MIDYDFSRALNYDVSCTGYIHHKLWPAHRWHLICLTWAIIFDVCIRYKKRHKLADNYKLRDAYDTRFGNNFVFLYLVLFQYFAKKWWFFDLFEKDSV